MNPAFLIKNLIAVLVLPPTLFLLPGALGWFLWRRRPGLARGLLAFALLGLWLSCTPIVAKTLIGTLEIPFRPLSGREADAIVVLGGGLDPAAPAYGGDTVNWRTLERLRYGARLHRQFGHPILVTGGSPTGLTPEARVMRQVLEDEFKVPVAFVEDRSNDTRDNARYSAALLRDAGIRRVYLVSQVWHLPRAAYEFRREGLEVVPAGIDYVWNVWNYPFEYLPNASSLSLTYFAGHEWLGRLWAHVHG